MLDAPSGTPEIARVAFAAGLILSRNTRAFPRAPAGRSRKHTAPGTPRRTATCHLIRGTSARSGGISAPGAAFHRKCPKPAQQATQEPDKQPAERPLQRAPLANPLHAPQGPGFSRALNSIAPGTAPRRLSSSRRGAGGWASLEPISVTLEPALGEGGGSAAGPSSPTEPGTRERCQPVPGGRLPKREAREQRPSPACGVRQLTCTHTSVRTHACAVTGRCKETTIQVTTTP